MKAKTDQENSNSSVQGLLDSDFRETLCRDHLENSYQILNQFLLENEHIVWFQKKPKDSGTTFFRIFTLSLASIALAMAVFYVVFLKTIGIGGAIVLGLAAIITGSLAFIPKGKEYYALTTHRALTLVFKKRSASFRQLPYRWIQQTKKGTSSVQFSTHRSDTKVPSMKFILSVDTNPEHVEHLAQGRIAQALQEKEFSEISSEEACSFHYLPSALHQKLSHHLERNPQCKVFKVYNSSIWKNLQVPTLFFLLLFLITPFPMLIWAILYDLNLMWYFFAGFCGLVLIMYLGLIWIWGFETAFAITSRGIWKAAYPSCYYSKEEIPYHQLYPLTMSFDYSNSRGKINLGDLSFDLYDTKAIDQLIFTQQEKVQKACPDGDLRV